MVGVPLSNLLSDLIEDLARPGIKWQAVAVLASAALGWALAWLIRKSLPRNADGERTVLRRRAQGFLGIAAPLIVVGLLHVAKYILANNHIHTNLVRVAIPVFLSLAVIRVAFFLLRRVFGRRGELGAAFVTFEKVFALLVWLGVVLYLTGLWDDIYAYLNSVELPIGKKRVPVADILQGAISVAVLLMLALWAGAALEERLMGIAGLHTSLRVVLARMGRTLLVLVSVLLCLPLMGLDLTVLSVFGGAFGVGLGLGMQRIASNYVSGFVILLERSLSLGDMISIDKYSGKVARINTRYTVLQGLDGVETVLPNEMLITGAVQNQSLSDRRVRGSTRLIVAYGSKLEEVMPLLEEQARSTDRVLADPGPGVGLARFAPEGYELDLGFWIGDPENGTGGVVSEINKKIYALVQAGQIKLGGSAVDIRLLDTQIASSLSRTAQIDAT
jgi:small-conductance mechanosensitive channel